MKKKLYEEPCSEELYFEYEEVILGYGGGGGGGDIVDGGDEE